LLPTIINLAVDPVTRAQPAFSSVINTAISPLAIVTHIKRGDRPMEAVFFQRYYTGVKRHLARYIFDPSHAEDIAHDALLTVLLRLRSKGIEQPQFLDRFVYQTAKFSYFSWLRRPANQPALFEPLEEHPDPMDTEQQFLGAEQRRLLHEQIDTLRIKRDREILRRAYIHNETKSAMCAALVLTTSHFDRIIFRARERLKQKLKLQDPDILAALQSNVF
jgi:RNA polymerase sigma-70 factor, ECF subfamily|tara:strand:- start:1491 stop:2147 length:657 start_codon:yes stop_codon:yes gene_type:complete